ncbi:phosphotransferase family protein [Salisaeta longa]|uniref:phosphotransferase family protein n=1 Tax=Salisaeta longa TaxID=503170 RepID=UPI0003B597E6|nr:phosphotransferase family protein [Salisaeta longa]
MAASADDTIPVRPDEALDVEALHAFLVAEGLDGVAEAPPTVRQFGGGHANLTYELTYDDAVFVLRRPPLGPVPEGAHDMAREFTVLRKLHPSFALAPQAFLYCDDPSVIGAPFFLMERRYGTVIRTTWPDALGTADAQAPAAAHTLVDTLARFHAVNYEAIGLGNLGRPDGFIERQIAGWWDRWTAARPERLSAMAATHAWLKAHVPTAPAHTLVHNDYKLDNLMLAAGDAHTPVAVLDWDMCTLGDPLSDLGALLAYWVTPDDPDAMQQFATMPVHPAFPTRPQLVERYAAAAEHDVSDVRFYHALGLFRLTVIVAQIYARYARGQTQDERFAALRPMIGTVAERAHDVATGHWE